VWSTVVGLTSARRRSGCSATITAFVFFQVFNLLNVGDDRRSVFSRETLENRSAFVATAAVVLLLLMIVELDALHGFMGSGVR
jgi:Ca2+-transporting ATPase